MATFYQANLESEDSHVIVFNWLAL